MSFSIGFPVFIGNIPYKRTIEDLMAILSERHLNPIQAHIQKDPKGRSMGYGFAYFGTQAQAEEAITKINGTACDDRILLANVGVRKPAISENRIAKPTKSNHKIFVGNLAFDTSEDEIRNFFEAAGQIESIGMPHFPEERKFKGYAFVKYVDSKDACRAVDEFHGATFTGRKIKVFFAK